MSDPVQWEPLGVFFVCGLACPLFLCLCEDRFWDLRGCGLPGYVGRKGVGAVLLAWLLCNTHSQVCAGRSRNACYHPRTLGPRSGCGADLGPRLQACRWSSSIPSSSFLGPCVGWAWTTQSTPCSLPSTSSQRTDPTCRSPAVWRRCSSPTWRLSSPTHASSGHRYGSCHSLAGQAWCWGSVVHVGAC